jgi:NADPH-dependent ferric siderophore reductase
MPPASPAPRAPYRVRHTALPRLLTVLRVTDLSPSLRRITLGGSDLVGFVSASPDDHVKLFFFPAGTPPTKPPMGPQGPLWTAGKPPMRDYTPRRFDAQALELDVEFVMHGEGPAALWAQSATPGTPLLIGGPRGSTIVPPRADGYLMVVDESGLPAAARWLESLPAAVPATVLVEVDGAANEIPLATQAALAIRWVHRDGQAAGRAPLLLETLQKMTRPPGDFFAWVACESGQSRAIRHFLEEHWQLDSESLKTAGYWKHGVADFHD